MATPDDWETGKKPKPDEDRLECCNPFSVPLGCVFLDFYLVPITEAVMQAGNPINEEAAIEIRNTVATQRVPPGGRAKGGVQARKLAYQAATARGEEWEQRTMLGDPVNAWAEELLTAVVHNQYHTVVHILAREDDMAACPEGVNLRNWQQRPVLNLACACGYIDIVRVLLGAGADPNIPDDQGFTPLHESAHEGYAPMVELLLKHGADPVGGTLWRSPPNQERLELAMSPLGVACKRGAHHVAVVLLGADRTLSAVLDRDGVPPFFTAALHKHIGCSESLLAHGRINLFGEMVPLPPQLSVGCKHPKNGLTPAHNAAYNNAVEVLEMLIKHKAPLEETVTTGETPLMLAAQCGFGEAVACLVNAGVNIEYRNEQSGVTAFHVACCGGTPAHADVAAFLVSKGATGVCGVGKCMKCKLLVKQARRRLMRQEEARRKKEAEEHDRARELEREKERSAVEQELEETCPSLFTSFADFADELRATEREAEEAAESVRQAKAEAKQSATAAAQEAGGDSKGKKSKKKGKGKGKKKKKK